MRLTALLYTKYCYICEETIAKRHLALFCWCCVIYSKKVNYTKKDTKIAANNNGKEFDDISGQLVFGLQQ